MSSLEPMCSRLVPNSAPQHHSGLARELLCAFCADILPNRAGLNMTIARLNAIWDRVSARLFLRPVFGEYYRGPGVGPDF